MNWQIDTHQIHVSIATSDMPKVPRVNTIEPNKATGRAPNRSIARPPKNWETHWPIAPGNMIRPLIVAEYPRSVWM